MLVNAVVLLVMGECSFVRSLRLVEVTLLLEEHANFYQGVNFALHSKVASKDTVLEVADSLVDLVCLSKDYAKLIQDVRLLVEVRGHLKDGD